MQPGQEEGRHGFPTVQATALDLLEEVSRDAAVRQGQIDIKETRAAREKCFLKGTSDSPPS